jgi:cyclophilin family peptidyl-prolyl cis-trans isomerase
MAGAVKTRAGGIALVLAAAALSAATGGCKRTGKTAKAGNPVVILVTSEGEITVELFRDKAPTTVRNFLRYVDRRFYDGTIFHRIVREGISVVQGGGYTDSLYAGRPHLKATLPPIKNEADNGLKNVQGTLAMARRKAPHSATSQFFFNLRDNPPLDHVDETPGGFGYAVFGQVLAGMDVVEKIFRLPVRDVGNFEGLPVRTVLIRTIQRAEKR